MDYKETTKVFPLTDVFFSSWDYCVKNWKSMALFALVNWLMLVAGLKLMGIGNLWFVLWCAIYYLYWCYFFRFYFDRKPYLLTGKIFDSLIPSTKILFFTLAFATILAFLPFVPLFLGLPVEVMDSYTYDFLEQYIDKSRLYDAGLAVVLLLVSPLIFFRPFFAWISSVIGRSGSIQNAWRRSRGNYWRFVLVVLLFNLPAGGADWVDVLIGAKGWLLLTAGAPLMVFCNVYIAKAYEFFFLDLE